MTKPTAQRPTKESVTRALKLAAELAKIDGSGRYTGRNLVTADPLPPVDAEQQPTKAK